MRVGAAARSPRPHPSRVVIDCHTHLNRYTPDQPASLAERHALLHAEMDANGIAHAVVITSYRVTADRPGLADTLRQTEGDPRISVVAAVRLETGYGVDLGEQREGLTAGRVRGLKLYPGYEAFDPTDARLRPAYELAAEFGVPVMIHTGDNYDPRARVRLAHPLLVDDVAVDHRDVTFVLCHLGNPWFTDAMEVIYKNDNVLGDFSGLTLGEFQPRFERWARERINEVLTYVNDPAKLMFGTDWPISDVGSYLRFTRGLDATPEEMEGILWRNAARVFGIDLGGETAEGGR